MTKKKTEAVEEAKSAEKRINDSLKRTAEDVFEIGKELNNMQSELGITPPHAGRYRRVAKYFGYLTIFSKLFTHQSKL